ncbi:chromate transporter [Azovibrio restrictus]|jgi:chromate transporter|uniref:chromate transporter n=1 Tax=Azovibrio restrictus TaxID=146938 RepID=UPI0026F12C3F|nr:chromate transporter [Azovibrio restrictus]
MPRVPAEPETPQPAAGAFSCTPPSLKELFLGFSSVGLSGFGGVLPFARRMLVEERKWLSPEDFNSLLGLCQFLPGPNVINLSVAVGARYRGVAGSVVAVLGLLGGPLLIVLALGALYSRFGDLPQVQGMLRGVAAAGCGLLVATAWRMGLAVSAKRVFLPFALLVFVLVALLRWPMPVVMVGLVLLAATVAHLYRKHHGAAG